MSTKRQRKAALKPWIALMNEYFENYGLDEEEAEIVVHMFFVKRNGEHQHKTVHWADDAISSKISNRNRKRGFIPVNGNDIGPLDTIHVPRPFGFYKFVKEFDYYDTEE